MSGLLDALRAALGPLGFDLRACAPGSPALLELEDGLTIELRAASAPGRSFAVTTYFAVSYRPPAQGQVRVERVQRLVEALRRVEEPLGAERRAALLAAAPAVGPGAGGDRAMRHTDRARKAEGAPLHVALINLCEDPSGYGPGASEYLRARLLSDPVAERIDLTLLFLSGTDTEEFARKVAELDADFLGFTCYSWNLAATAAVSRALRERHRGGGQPVIVWGGCSFALLRERSDWFTWWGDVDAVAIGSGEQTVVDLVRRATDRGPRRGLGAMPIRGAILRSGSSLLDGGPAQTPRSLAEVPSPYQLGAAFQVARPFLEMARGCRFECAFCSDARSSREGLWLTNTVERVAADIRAVAAWPCAREIDAGASTANVSEQHFAEVCEGIRQGDPGQRLSYSLQIYPAIVRPSQREALRGVRVKRLGIGVQSSTPETWGPMRRKSTLEHIHRAAGILRDAGPIYVTVLLGLPGETLESFRSMVTELLQIDDISLAVHRLLVLPGSQFHARAREHSLEFNPDRFYRLTRSGSMDERALSEAQEFTRELAAREGFTSRGERRIDWTNFDDQRLAFDGAPMAQPRGALSGASTSEGRSG